MPTLDWLKKEAALKTAGQIPYRILEHNSDLSCGDENNMLIQGDNLDALKALLPYYAGQVKCIYIDPPYNTKNAFEHYNDNLEHSTWLSLMYPRLEILREFLLPEGTIWISIDDNESNYLKVICDEVFGRNCFVSSVIWRTTDNSNNDAKQFSVDHNTILVYSKSSGWISKRISPPDEKRKHFKNPDNDPKGPWFDGNPLSSPNLRENLCYDLTAPNGNIINYPHNGWRWSKETMAEKIESGEIRFTEDCKSIKRRTYLYEQTGLPPSTLWIDLEETGHNRQAKYEQKKLFPEWVKEQWFGTPKPEKLIKKILDICTIESDIVMDSFLGSGTTAAVAHKMNRRWIGIEMGDHAVTHCVPRIRKVIDGEQGGISKAENWQGGGGFRFYRLGAPIFDAEGKIHPEVRFETLANHIWFVETGCPLIPTEKSPLLGIHHNIAYYLLFNGILGDKTLSGGNVLTTRILNKLPKHDGPKVIYGELTKLSTNQLKELQISFKQIPYDIKAR
jgi:adenine-specific DNA-methyltransferase